MLCNLRNLPIEKRFESFDKMEEIPEFSFTLLQQNYVLSYY